MNARPTALNRQNQIGLPFPLWMAYSSEPMKSVSIRCRLEDRVFPIACFVLVALAILTKVVLAFSQHRHLDMFDLLIQLALAAGFFHLIVSGRASLWVVTEFPEGIRLERDGAVLFEGPPSGLQIVDEDRAIMTLRSSGGSTFLFPRRRVFHHVISRIPGPEQPTGRRGLPSFH